ncbi:MAG TPA: trehalose-phosphatase [Actinomycetota bacterium]|nr:trehalose-phosphatase [Actinomycetota bacterium]
MTRDELVAAVCEQPAATGIFSDFDGTLAEIVDDPFLARGVDGAWLLLEDLARRFAVVAVVSGRSITHLLDNFNPEGVLLSGSHGLQRSDRERRYVEQEAIDAASEAVELLAHLPGVKVERKPLGAAIHWRLDPDSAEAARRVAEEVAPRHGMILRPGRMVLEMALPGPGKGGVISDLIAEHGLGTVLFAGDDLGDLEAFRHLRTLPVRSLLVAVATPESPDALREAADLAVDSPRDVVALLSEIQRASELRPPQG